MIARRAMETQPIQIESLPAEEVRPGVTRRTFSSERMTYIRYVYAPGAVFPSHSHAQEQITLVLQGRIAFTVGEGTVELGPGEAAVIPAGVEHGARVLGDEEVVTDNVMAPRREGPITLQRE